MLHLEKQELLFFIPFLHVDCQTLHIALLLCSNALLDLNDLVFLANFFFLLFFDLSDKLLLAVLGLELLSHGKSHRTLVKNLVCLVGTSDIFTDAKEQKSAFGQIQCDLANDFVEALYKKLFTNWAES